MCDTAGVDLPKIDLSQLTRAQKLALLEQLEQSLAGDQDVSMSPAAKKELDRRLAALDRDGGNGIPWQQFESELRRLMR